MTSNTYFNMEAIKKALKRGTLVLTTGAMICFMSSCEINTKKEVSTNNDIQYDLLNTENDELVNSGIEQILDVPGEDFKLVINNKCLLDKGEKWTITSDKEMLMNIHTLGLNPNTKVYIDNIHIDTTITSVYPEVDGITQDSMDDRVHNSKMKGFPISDTNDYITINCIEGQNQTFIQGSFYGFRGYSSGEISERRYIESDYLKAGVTGNKINSVIDLIIEKEDGTTTCTSVFSTLGVSVCPYIKIMNSNGEYTYRYYHYDEKEGRVISEEFDELKVDDNDNIEYKKK